MFKYIAIAITILITSFVYFPCVLIYFPWANTKMIIAGLGLVTFLVNLALGRRSEIEKPFLNVTLFAILVSLVGYVACEVNGTQDHVYASYIVTMWVWMGGAYFVVNCIRFIHGYADLKLIGNYLIAVCFFQCLLALTMEMYTPLKNYIDSILLSRGFMGIAEGRMYGLGAALDVGGMKFAAVLVVITGILFNKDAVKLGKKQKSLYIISSFVITIVGNMIARSTIIGVVLALLFILSYYFFSYGSERLESLKTIKTFVKCLTPIVILAIFLYNFNDQFRSDLRFGFEGFFSLIEDGYWHTNSNDALAEMVVFPDNLRTWVIGDGYFDNSLLDPFYVGNSVSPFYMGTDIGYLRFLFYFGLIGTLTFVCFFLVTAIMCAKITPQYKGLIYCILLLNLIFWCKVASDLFPLFAMFLCAQPILEEKQEASIKDGFSIDEPTTEATSEAEAEGVIV